MQNETNLKGIKAVILCGGQGTRLREETEYKPKPMVSIGGAPIIWHIMKIYAHFGVRDFVLCLGYKGEMIKDYFLHQELMSHDITINPRTGKQEVHKRNDREAEDWNITLADTGANANTGARVKRIEKYINEDEFMLTYGDGLSNIDINELVKHHRRMKLIGTLSAVNPQSRYGMVKADEKGIVTQFLEKPVLVNEYVNGGFYVFNKKFFEYVDEKDQCVLETEPLNKLAHQKQLSMRKHSGFWHGMDTYKDYLDLNKLWDSGNVPWKVWK